MGDSFKTNSPVRILLVDDEPDVRASIQLILEHLRHQVTVARDAEDALANFAPGRFDLVITDYSMPGMKGDALAAKIRAVSPGQPIILKTAYFSSSGPNGNVTFPQVNLILNVPFSIGELEEAIKQALGTD